MPALQRRFGRLVASYRRQRKLTQAQLAEETGQSKDMIAKIEAGRTGVSFENIEQIARALDLDPAALFSAEVLPGKFKDGPKRRILERLSLLTDDDFSFHHRMQGAEIVIRVWLGKCSLETLVGVQNRGLPEPVLNIHDEVRHVVIVDPDHFRSGFDSEGRRGELEVVDADFIRGENGGLS